MPWTPKQFKDKHGKKLTKAQSKKAAEIANSIIEEEGEEAAGKAIAIALSAVKTKVKKCTEGCKKKDGVKESSKSVKYKPKKISKRKDVNPKTGVKEYGDVKFADDKNKKYPLDSEEHIRSAWSYIHQEKNADKYAAEEVELIKSRIVKAWKKKIDEEGPPAAQEQEVDEKCDTKKKTVVKKK
jgi:hypothetical protein